MKKSLLILIAMIFTGLAPAIAQKIELGIQASVNYPCIPTVTMTDNPPSQPAAGTGFTSYGIYYADKYQETYQDYPGAKISLNVNYNFKHNFYLRSGLGLNLIRFKRDVHNIHPYYENYLIGYFTDTVVPSSVLNKNIGKTSVLYTEIPVLAGYRFCKKKFSVCLGFTISFVAWSEQCRTTQQYVNGILEMNKVINDKTSTGLVNTTFSVNAECSYTIKSRYSVFLRYSKQLNPIYDADYQFGGKAKYSLFEAGAGYRIL